MSLQGSRIARVLFIGLLGAWVAPLRAEPPMWVIKDADSMLYLFGTVHVLDPNIEWRTERVEHALGEATELWEEVVMPTSLQELQAQQGPVIMKRALSPDRPLSSLLNDEEKAQLRRALARTPQPERIGAALEHMKPWFVSLNLSMAPLLSAGYRQEAGVDIVLARLAREQGDELRGFETVEQQLEIFAGGTDERQLEVLRIFLAVSDEQFSGYIERALRAYRAWMAGDVAPVAALIDDWRTGKNALMSSTMPYDSLVAERNQDWAGQIEKLLADQGTAFIAVGAGHLVGPDSVQAQLAKRGIHVLPY